MQEWFESVDPGSGRRPAEVGASTATCRRQTGSGASDRRGISDATGEVHTVVPGRPIGLHPHTVQELAQAGVHLHFYGDFTHGQWLQWIEKTRGLAPEHLHLHPNVSQDGWVEEFSQYDAGWLHFFQSENGGEIRRSNWDDLNLPARLATLAVCGLPMLQRNNSGHTVATQTIVRDLDLGLFFEDMATLGEQLRDRERMRALRENVWRQRRAVHVRSSRGAGGSVLPRRDRILQPVIMKLKESRRRQDAW